MIRPDVPARPPHPSRRWTLLSTRALRAGLLLAALPSATVSAICENAPPGPFPVGDSSPGVVLRQVGAESGDLTLEIEGGPGAVILDLLDGDRQVIASQAVDLGGHEQVRMEQALAEVPQRGFQLHLRSTDPETGGIHFEVPLRAGLDCQGDEPCLLTVRAGLDSDGPVADPELMEVLRELDELQVEDPFEIVRTEFPELRGSLYELLLQSEWPSIEPGSTSDCLCQWVGTLQVSAPIVSGGLTGFEPLHVRESWPGFPGVWAAQMTAGSYSHLFDGHQDLGLRMELVCKTLSAGSTQLVSLESGSTIPVTFPVASPCPAPCSAQVEHSGTVASCAESKGFGHAGLVAEANLSVTATVSIDGHLETTGTAAVLLAASLPTGQAQSQTASTAITKQVQATASEALYQVSGWASLEISGDSTKTIAASKPYVFARVAAHPAIQASGSAQCAVTPSRSLSYFNSTTSAGGGKVIERWGDPP